MKNNVIRIEIDSRVPHLHAAVCRKDRDGRTNNDHKIHIRAHDAAQEVAIKRGWITAMEIHKANADKVAEDFISTIADFSAQCKSTFENLEIISSSEWLQGMEKFYSKAS